MLSRRAAGPLVVQVPGPDEDRPHWKKVASIAAAGFVIGIAWPRLAGVRMGPSLPEVSSATATIGSVPAGQPPPSAPQAPALPAAASLATNAPIVGAPRSASPQPPPVPSVAVAARGVVTKTSDPTDGTAQVVWEVAIIRDAPKTGKIVARVQRGSTLRVGPVKDGWYPVRYGEGFSGDGWVYRGAIGR